MNQKLLLRESITNLCLRFGSNSMLVQGAGGNVSWKDNNQLWIKASGAWLANARSQNIFVALDYSHIRNEIARGNFSFSPRILSDSDLKPSIETMLHCLMPQKIVAHIHAIEPLVHLVREKFPEQSGTLLAGLPCAMIDYRKPGDALAKAVSAALAQSPNTQILLLRNHGIVIGGGDATEIDALLAQLLQRLAASQLIYPDPYPSPPAKPKSGYTPIDMPEIHALATDPRLFSRLGTDWALYPDHVVFLGPKAWRLDQIDQLRSLEQQSDPPLLAFVANIGVYAREPLNPAQQAQLRCYYDILVRQPETVCLQSLTHTQIGELLNWDAEQYRQQLASGARI